MKPTDLIDIRTKLKLTQEQFASLLKITRRTMIRYEAGERDIPEFIELKAYQLVNKGIQ